MKKRSLIVAIYSLFVLSLLLLSGCSNKTGNLYEAGTFQGTGNGKNGEITVAVTFKADRIDSVKILEETETPGIGTPALEKLPLQIVKEQSLAIDSVTGATYTSQGILEAVGDAVGLAGGNLDLLQKKAAKSTAVLEESVDLVIVGAGAAGLMAATEAVRSDLQVLIIEKGANLAVSNFAHAGGPSASETRMQKAANAELSNETLYNHMYGFSHGTVNSGLLKSVISNTGACVNYLLDLGIEMDLMADTYGVGFRGRHFIIPEGLERMNPIQEYITTAGGKFLFETAGEELLLDDQGRVVGVKAVQSDGTTLNIHSRVVLISTGGFLGNKDMLAEYFPGGNVVPLGNTLSTGDGIKMVLDAGGVMDRNFALLGNEGGAASSKIKRATYDENWAIANENLCYWIYGGLYVNQYGERFVNEKRIADEPLSIGGEIIAREGKVYTIVDQAYIEACSTEGIYKYLGEPEDWVAGLALWYPVLQNAPTQLQSAMEEGWAYKADSLSELAEKTGLKKLEATVSRYNSLAEKGEDLDYGKSSAFMIPVNAGPYYAFEYDPSAWATNGGVKVDNKLRPIDGSNNPIEGLFVAGADAGSIYTAPYYNNEGASLGISLGSGKYAGKMISAYLKQGAAEF